MKTIGKILMVLIFFSLLSGCSDDESNAPQPSQQPVESGQDFIANFMATPSSVAVSSDDVYKIQLSGKSQQSSFGSFEVTMCVDCNENQGSILNCYGCISCSSEDAIYFSLIQGEIVSDPYLWFIGLAVIDEGTGKFADVSGAFEIKGFRSNPDEFIKEGESYEFVCYGKLFYPTPNRDN